MTKWGTKPIWVRYTVRGGYVILSQASLGPVSYPKSRSATKPLTEAGAAFLTAFLTTFLTAFLAGAFFPTARVAKGALKAAAEAKSKANTVAVFILMSFNFVNECWNGACRT